MQVIISSSCPLGGGGQGNVVRYFAEGLYVKGILHSAITSRLVHADIPYDKIIETYPIIAGLVYKIPRLKWNLKSLIRDRLHDILASYKIRQCDILYGWANNSLLTFKKAQELNIITCLEVPTSHISNRLKIIKEEELRWGLIPDNCEVHEKIQLAEYENTDYIIVPSVWAYQSFVERKFPKDKIKIRPYGVNLAQFTPNRALSCKFRVIFVGALLLHKGFQYLLEAWQRIHLPQSELVIAGRIFLKSRKILRQFAHLTNVEIIGEVKDVKKLYNTSSVFVFPSLEEGSALVTYEALACGLPVITTFEAGSVVRDVVDGFIIPSRNPTAIAEKICYLYEHPNILKEMSYNARKRAEEFTWEKSVNKLIEIYSEILCTHST